MMSRNPYHIENKDRALLDSVLVFMDILGYSKMIELSENEENLFKELYEALSEGRSWLNDGHFPDGLKKIGKKDLYALKAFTDNIVIGWPVRDDAEVELGNALFKLSQFQFQMATKGFFVRGALSIGAAYVDEIAVFGGALIEAHQGESVFARDPRIILTSSAIKACKQHLTYYSSPAEAPHTREILCDTDGQWFINYLSCVLWAEHENGPFYDEFQQHKLMTEDKLRQFKDNPVVWAKYSWVASYHNYFCDLHPLHFSEEHKVNIELFKQQPRLIV